MVKVKTASQRYVRLSQREHILKRPDTQVGSIISEDRDVFVVEDINDFTNIKIVQKNINYNSGFVKLFDEVIVNASDCSIRTNNVTYIKVTINGNVISVENDGDGIPVEMHDEEKIYIPELIFGHLLTSENYDDEEERYVGGRNGIGVKAVNIFSKKFIIETADGKKYYKQIFEDNLSIINEPEIKKSKSKYVRVTYETDLEKFGLSEISDDMKSVIIRRIIDISAYNPTIKVYYNNNLIPVNNFKDYMKLFMEEDTEFFHEQINDQWEIGITKSPTDQFTQMSMVNGICTLVGGTHVNHITNYLVNNVKEILTKTNKGINIRSNDIKNNFLVFLNTKIVNPVFESQTKEVLSSKINGLSNIKISEAILKKIAKSGILADLIELSLMKDQIELKNTLKSTTKKIKIDKLIDANKAGTNESSKCSIFLTEGLSAKTCAITGFSQTGRDYYGVYPLKGKPLNVRDVSMSKIKNNDEIKDMIQFLGLEFGKTYTDTSSLRYGKVVIMSDADCISGESMVKTGTGLKAIKDLDYYDMVLTHSGNYRRVINIIQSIKSEIVIIKINNNEMKFGLYHKIPVLTENGFEVKYAKDITKFDKILVKKYE